MGGQLPEYFQMWLETCRWNPTVDFLLFTDDQRKFDYPPNVYVHLMSFQEMIELFQEKFDFKISLDAPYKFCDYKPAYGEIFSEYLQGYDYWGHCDIDLFWGNIRKFITDELLQNYKRIFSHGHCSLYRNTAEVNAWYRTLPNKGYQDWKMVYQTNKSCCYDEWAGHCGGGISQIMKSNGIEFYDEICFADINVMSGWFKINYLENTGKKSYFYYDKGILKMVSDKCETEFLYAHFQKRKPEIKANVLKDVFYFVAPNYITSDVEDVRRQLLKEKIFEAHKIINKIQSKRKK